MGERIKSAVELALKLSFLSCRPRNNCSTLLFSNFKSLALWSEKSVREHRALCRSSGDFSTSEINWSDC